MVAIFQTPSEKGITDHKNIKVAAMYFFLIGMEQLKKNQYSLDVGEKEGWFITSQIVVRSGESPEGGRAVSLASVKSCLY